jgi:hypothetical protein
VISFGSKMLRFRPEQFCSSPGRSAPKLIRRDCLRILAPIESIVLRITPIRAPRLGREAATAGDSPVDLPSFLRPVCLVLSVLALIAGGLGMALSFLVMTSSRMTDITAGTSGFLAGSVLIAAGLVSLTMLATRPVRGKAGRKQVDRALEELV